MATPLTALCLLLVDDIFGQLAAQIYETLSIHGRLSLPALGKHTGLNPRRIRHSLAILVQQNLVLWNTDDSDNAFYETHPRNAYSLIRQGRLSRIIDERFGQVGQAVVTALMLSGHAQVSDLVTALSQEASKPSKANGVREPSKHTNGKADNNTAEAEEKADEIRATLLALIDAGLLTIVKESHFRPAADNRTDATAVELRVHGDKVKKAEEESFQRKVNNRLLDWQYNSSTRKEVLERTGMVDFGIGKRRRTQEDGTENGPSKRQRTCDSSHGRSKITFARASIRALSSLDNHVVKINHDKLTVFVRNEKLADVVAVHIGPATSLVYEELLDRITKCMLYCKTLPDPSLQAPLDEEKNVAQDEEVETATLVDIAAGTDLTEFTSAIGRASKAEGNDWLRVTANGTIKKAKIEYDNEEDGDSDLVMTNGHTDKDEDDDEEPLGRKAGRLKKAAKKRLVGDDTADLSYTPESNITLVRQHLLLLKEDMIKFVELHRGTHLRTESWGVNFDTMSRYLRTSMIEDIIRARYGMPALRLVSILREKGKLDQKYLGALSLLPNKQMFTLLTAMHSSGYLDLQEVPKDSQRVPGKTIFLWFFDEARCAIRMLEDTYKAMTRAMQRVKIEREKYQGVIEKSQRTDVVGHEDEMLNDHEKRDLATWRENTDKLIGQLGRLDDVVFCLRDF